MNYLELGTLRAAKCDSIMVRLLPFKSSVQLLSRPAAPELLKSCPRCGHARQPSVVSNCTEEEASPTLKISHKKSGTDAPALQTSLLIFDKGMIP